jgi:hypothetical protein
LKALFLLPCVYLGLCKDFWLNFDKYVRIEKDFKSTFFLIPFKNRPGDKVAGRFTKRRATRYDIADIQEDVRNLLRNGFEIGVHGIDAWHSTDKADMELDRISQFIGKSDIGIRLHWLCFDERSFKILDEAGFSYDSTFGYNETVGYRGGTTQVFRPMDVKNLLELPLHIQDMALLSPSQMGLSETEAWALCKRMTSDVLKYGGVLTILWHLRSLAPERLWDDFYLRLLDELNALNGWFAPANQIVEWFRRRRSVVFREAIFEGKKLRLHLKLNGNESDSKLMLRIHTPDANTSGSSRIKKNPVDILWNGRAEMEIAIDK